MTKREDVLSALFERLKSLDIPVKRNESLPQLIPNEGLIILRDGKQGEPEYILSPPMCLFKHEAEVEVITQAIQSEVRDKQLDEILEKVGVILSPEEKLGGLVDFLYPNSPEIMEEHIEGIIPIKAAIIPVILEYASKTGLN